MPHVITQTFPHAYVDRQVRIWSRKGVHLGTLRALIDSERHWHFDDDEAVMETKAKLRGKVRKRYTALKPSEYITDA